MKKALIALCVLLGIAIIPTVVGVISNTVDDINGYKDYVASQTDKDVAGEENAGEEGTETEAA